MPVCTSCKTDKPDADFYKDGKKKTGLFAECKLCNRNRNREWWGENYEKVKKDYYRNTIKYRAKDRRAQLLRGAKSRAKKRGMEFSLTKENVKWNDVCPVFGFELNYSGQGKKVADYNAASLDRVDNNKGYTPENVIVISHRANAIKRDATLEELKALVAWLQRMV